MVETRLTALTAIKLEVLVRHIHLDSVLVAAAIVTVLLPARSRSTPITFERVYGGAGDDLGFSVKQTSDGGYVVAGVTESFGAGGYDFYLIRTGAGGDTLWTRTFGGAQNDVGWSVQQTTDDGYAIAGCVAADGAGLGEFWLIKTDTNGDTLWTRTYGGALAEVAVSMEQTTDAGYIVAGYTESFGAGGEDIWLVKTDANGDTLWAKTFGGMADDEGWSVRQTADSGYIIAGTTWSFGAGESDVYVIRTDAEGNALWTKTFGGDSSDTGNSAQQTADGGFIVAGWTWSYADVPQFYLVRTDEDGDTLWTRTIRGPGMAECSSVEQVEDGGCIMVGICGEGLPDVYLVRTDAGGETLWTRTFGGSDFDGGISVQPTKDGGYVIAGETYSLGAGLSDFYLIKTDGNGNVGVAEPTTSPSPEPIRSLAIEPNPFRSSAVLHLTTNPLDRSSTHVRIYDALGRLVRTFAASDKSRLVWDGTDNAGRLLSSGTYLVRCGVAGKYAAVRVVLQR